MTKTRTPLLLDTDPGIDDAIALFALLALPDVDIVAVTTVFGNASVAQTTTNALSLLKLGGRTDIPVHAGAATPLDGSQPSGAALVHGKDGLGDVGLTDDAEDRDGSSAVDAIIELSHTHAGTLRIVAIGPLTNLALALRRDPTIVRRVHSVTVMGGAAFVPGNVTPAAEANFFADPEAAQAVLQAPWETVVAPLDVTQSHPYFDHHRSELLTSNRVEAIAVGRMLPIYFDFYREHARTAGIYLHDAVAALLAGGVIETSSAPRVAAAVATEPGVSRGALIADLRSGAPLVSQASDGVSTIVFAVDRPVAEVVHNLLLHDAPVGGGDRGNE